MKTHTLIFSLYLLILWQSVSAQDPHFSHIHASPLNNNPAWTGVFNDNFRLIANYRNQWKSPTSNFNTFSMSFDGNYHIPRTKVFVAGGLSFLTDKGGDLGYGNNNYNFLGALAIPLGRRGRNFLTTGAQVGLITQHIDLSNIVSIDDEPLVNSVELKKKTLDLSVGVGYFFSQDEYKTIYGGVALYHVNQPDVSLLEYSEVQLYKRWVANIGAMWEIRHKFGLEPSAILYWQGPHREVCVGSYLSVKLTDSRFGSKHDTRIHVGLWGRYYINSEYNSGFDAIIMSCKYDIDHVSFAFSTDITLSRLVRGTSLIGSPELSVIYSFSTNRVKKEKSKIDCPVF